MKKLLMFVLVFAFVFKGIGVLSAVEKQKKIRPVTEKTLYENTWKWENGNVLCVYQFRQNNHLSVKLHRKGIDKNGDFSSSASFWWRIDKEKNTLCFYSQQGKKEWTFNYCSPCFIGRISMEGDMIELENRGDIKILRPFSTSSQKGPFAKTKILGYYFFNG